MIYYSDYLVRITQEQYLYILAKRLWEPELTIAGNMISQKSDTPETELYVLYKIY